MVVLVSQHAVVKILFLWIDQKFGACGNVENFCVVILNPHPDAVVFDIGLVEF